MSPKITPETPTMYISREHLALWLDRIAEQYGLIAPRDVDGFVLYRKANGAAEIVWDYTRPVMPIKDAFFPPTERLFTIEKNGQEVQLIESEPPSEQVLFGVRPCDAHGLQALDALFLATEPVDPFYARRRENATIIGLACNEMSPTCFCTSMGSAPDDSRFVDIMLREVRGGYAFQVISDRGAELLQRVSAITEPYQTETIKKEWGASPGFSNPPMEAWSQSFDNSFWEDISERCLSCRACAYVCPTCRCFDVRDEALFSSGEAKRYERIRCWDSCAGETYRRIAGGHNPRREKGQRLRNRFFCKFYYFPLQYGPEACTGCGRCIDVCPAGVDITEVLQHMTGNQSAGVPQTIKVGVR